LVVELNAIRSNAIITIINDGNAKLIHSIKLMGRIPASIINCATDIMECSIIADEHISTSIERSKKY
jgi:hypothetical protein